MKRSKKEAKAQGAAIRAMRKTLNLSLVKLSELSKISFSMIARAERGGRNLSKKAQARLEQAFAAETERLLKNKEMRGVVVEAVGAVVKAQKYVSTCELLPWMRSNLPAALEQLAAAQANLDKLKPEIVEQRDVFEDPFVRGIMESKDREIGELAVELEGILLCARGAKAGNKLYEGMFQHWVETGESPIQKIGTLTPEKEAATKKIGQVFQMEDGSESVVLPDDWEEKLHAQGVKKMPEGEE